MNRIKLPEKWIAGLEPDGPVTQAAQRVVERRLAAVAEMVRMVVKTRAEDDEAVHQLRVSTRRAEAALLAFKPWLRREKRKEARKALRKVRAAAGQVRMCDVQRELLAEAMTTHQRGERSTIESALIMLDNDRQEAIASLFAAARRVADRESLGDKSSRWARREKDDESSTDAAPETNLRTAGESALRELAQAFRDAAKKDLTSRENLHQMRVRGKHLRYAIEIFGATAGDIEALAAISDAIVDLQERLGQVNDSHELAEQLAHYSSCVEASVGSAARAGAGAARTARSSPSSSLAPRLDRLADQFETRCSQLATEFLQWWRGEEAATFLALIDQLATEPPPPVEHAPDIVVVHRNGQATAYSAVPAETPSATSTSAREGDSDA